MTAPDNPILNSPFQRPARHWKIDETGAFTQQVVEGRRRSEHLVPVAALKKTPRQGDLGLERTAETGETLSENPLVNEIRGHVERGGNDPYKRLKTTLKAEIDEDAWASLHSATSRPFDKPATGQIAVKVINHYGDEVLKVFSV